MDYQNAKRVESEACPGATLVLRRMSFNQRLELMHEVRDFAARLDFLKASESQKEVLEGRILEQETAGIYLRWGIERIEGLTIDGVLATPELLLEKGPEDLVKEALDAIIEQIGLSEEERKN